jgi:hypothetical protein
LDGTAWTAALQAVIVKKNSEKSLTFSDALAQKISRGGRFGHQGATFGNGIPCCFLLFETELLISDSRPLALHSASAGKLAEGRDNNEQSIIENERGRGTREHKYGCGRVAALAEVRGMLPNRFLCHSYFFDSDVQNSIRCSFKIQ